MLPKFNKFDSFKLAASFLAATFIACSSDVAPKANDRNSDGSVDNRDNQTDIGVDSQSSTLPGTSSNLAREDLSQVKVPTAAEVQSTIVQDVKSAQGGNIVYVDIQHLAKTEVGTNDLEIVRFAISKALNSVSLNPKIVPLTHIEPSQTVFRVNLDDYTLTSSWNLVKEAKFAKDNMTTVDGVDVFKGDWLVYTLTRPEVYDRIMRIPATVPALEAALKVDRSQSIYANVPQSGVTFTGRVVERMPLEIGGKPGGYYWRSYDFGSEAARIAGFANPATLIPASASVLALVAGEYIFSLPNGLQAYMLSGFAQQARIDAQLFVATDPRRPQDGLDHCVGGDKACGYVINGESCMTCHKGGMRYPTQIEGFKPAGSDEKLRAFMAADEKRFATAIAEMGFSTQGAEPIYEAVQMFLARTGFKDKRVQGGEFEGVRVTGGMFDR